MRQTPRALTALILITLSVSTVAACSDNPPGGRTLPTTSETQSLPQSPTPTPSPTPAPPTVTPTNGESETRTLVRQFVALESYARATGDVEPLLAISDPACESCEGIADVIRKVYDAGGGYEGDFELQIVNMEGDKERIFVIAKNGDYERSASPNAKPTPYKGRQLSRDFTLKREASRWVVKEIMAYKD